MKMRILLKCVEIQTSFTIYLFSTKKQILGSDHIPKFRVLFNKNIPTSIPIMGKFPHLTPIKQFCITLVLHFHFKVITKTNQPKTELLSINGV